MRKLLLKRAPHNPRCPGPIVRSAEEDRILAQQWLSCLSVPHLLSGRSEEAKDFQPRFLSSGIVNYVNQCLGLLYFVDNGPGASLVWNPYTKAQRYIPPPTRADVLHTPEVGYTYNVTSCFGYDPRSGAFKVLKYVNHVPQIIEEDGIAYDNGPDEEQYLLYSTQTNRWVDFPCPEFSYQLEHGSVYLNGCGFWIGFGGDIVVSFSFLDENFSSFPLNIPTLNRRDHGYRVIMVEVDEENALGFVVYKESHFQFWTCVINSEPDDGGCEWLKRWEFCVDFPEECGTSSLFTAVKGRPLLVYENGDELVMFMVNLNDQLMVYSSAAKELKLLSLFSYPRALQLISYHETSIDPNSV
ncbi:hypothetical protein C2S53_010990 [Perilla frutescens var. hirtella]|uniref:F-box associated beta-propeller type 1 domain-containing protein n=1 Tax=Perilla frutescens var. hirtella TaxID=608512 RepID=A0AAD4JCP5_PERFH|nr:hypothetical protein C2S53_010990 [Perilla frutescens var. hirtella]